MGPELNMTTPYNRFGNLPGDSPTQNVISTTCTCHAGCTTAFCKHVFALLHAINDYITKKIFLEGHTNQKKSHSSVHKSSKPLTWNENAEKAFLVGKNAIEESTLLRHPVSGAPLSLWVDASDIAMGSTLSQSSQGKWEHEGNSAKVVNIR
ncbi:transposon Ty3-G Gag-Pol polyprotein [Trichonephila clavipes]|nr:transposon Ty3-G Gag-Pol polyprotein [Trichonephila clavipes]